MQIEVSVIVPVYNVEKYIEECLQSILLQNFDNMEIICVEDCSQDHSLEKLTRIAKQDCRIKIIKHDMNRGLSAARNRGLKIARGKYVIFVDSDDMLAPNALNLLYREAEKNSVDIVYFDYLKFYDLIEYDIDPPKIVWGKYDGVYTGKSFFCETMRNNEFKCEACRQFIRRKFLIEQQIDFFEGILHEDNLFSFYAAMRAQTVCNINKELYYYRQRKDSIMRTRDSRRAPSLFVILSEIFSFWKSHEFTQEESFYVGRYWESLYCSYKIYQSDGESAKELWCGDEVEKTVYRILNNHVEKKWINTDVIVLDEIKQFKHVIVYGAGRAAKQVIDYFRVNNIDVTCIMVKNKDDNPDKFCGLSVYQIEECLDLRDDSVVVVGVTSKYSNGIENALKQMRYKNVISLPDADEK